MQRNFSAGGADYANDGGARGLSPLRPQLIFYGPGACQRVRTVIPMAFMMRFRWNKPCAADSCWLTSPGNAAERGMVPEGIHAKAAEATFPVRFPAPGNAHPNAGVRTVPDGIHERLLITARPGHRVASAGPGGRPQRAGGDVEVGQAAGSLCGSRPSAWAEVLSVWFQNHYPRWTGHVDVDGVDMLDDHLSGHELLDRLLAAAIPGGRNQSVGHGRHFIGIRSRGVR